VNNSSLSNQDKATADAIEAADSFAGRRMEVETADSFPTEVVGESCGIRRASSWATRAKRQRAIGPSFSSEPEGSRKTATAEGSRSRDQRLVRRCFLDQRRGKGGPTGVSYHGGFAGSQVEAER
jgi:hypothetical protein